GGLDAVLLRVVHHLETLGGRERDAPGGLDLARIAGRDRVLVRGPGVLDVGRVDAVERRRAGQDRILRQHDVPLLDAALHQAVDVEIARADEDRAVGDDAAAQLGAVILDRGRIAADVPEAVDEALYEIAVLGLHVHGPGADVAVHQDAPGLAVHRHRAPQVLDVARQLDVRRRRRNPGTGAEGVVVAGDRDR